MSTVPTAFWRFLTIFFVILSLWMAGLVLRAPAPAPLVIPAETVPEPQGVSSRAELLPPLEESPSVKSGFDEKMKIGLYLKLRGWVFVERQPAAGQEVYVELTKNDGSFVHYSTVPADRPDIADAFKNPIYRACGFSALIPLRDGAGYDLAKCRFVVRTTGGTFKSAPWACGL